MGYTLVIIKIRFENLTRILHFPNHNLLLNYQKRDFRNFFKSRNIYKNDEILKFLDSQIISRFKNFRDFYLEILKIKNFEIFFS
jgi:hypothetical protein